MKSAIRYGVLLVTAVLLLALLVWKWEPIEYGTFGTTDFIEYWSAGRVWLEGGSPYDLQLLLKTQQEVGWPFPGPLQMWNPPWLLVWMLPFILVPFSWGTGLWLFTNLALILFCSTSLWKWLSPVGVRERPWIAWLASLMFGPTWLALGLGQTSALCLLGVILFILFSRRQQYFLAGMAAALVTVKPHLVYLWVLVLAWEVLRKRQWETLLGSVALLGPSTLVLMFFRPSILLDYWESLRNPPLYWATPTLGTLFREWLPSLPAQVQYLPPLITALLLLFLLLSFRRRLSAQSPSDTVLLLAVSVPTAAFGWSFDQVVLLGPFLAVFLVSIDRETNWMVRVGGALGLVFYSAGHLLMNVARYDEASKIWLAWVLLATYILVVKLRAR